MNTRVSKEEFEAAKQETIRVLGYTENRPRCGNCAQIKQRTLNKDGRVINRFLCKKGNFHVRLSAICNYWVAAKEQGK